MYLSADDLRELITAAKDSGVTFVYALSPGLDITFSSKEDVDILKRKLKQVMVTVRLRVLSFRVADFLLATLEQDSLW